ncbi:DUF402 domain-containing protein [Ureaplasma sp. ES3154-GEN]|uniref:DUF402 domain-containing protein n=1 Tax=Ureaplasma sp. ES3154-GEN TaxID=2984844 RepID=UPI0021E968DF|nr:DUF402 domain-containing protein [Ureaplasma sp. ES3154-GEN]MCV3743360.1 DUF402 domain-containing protein [Ureaplasma sp. ES3154-GEN]
MNKNQQPINSKKKSHFDRDLLTNELTNYQDLSALKIHQEIMVHAYKLNGWLYRSWNNPMVVGIEDDLLVLCSTNSLVITAEEYTKRNFPSYTNKTSYWFFFKKEWFNIIATIEKTGMKFYINIASPFIYEEEAIKYYDFDLDFKISADKQWREVDFDEFLENSKKYNYPPVLMHKILDVEKRIEKLIQERVIEKLISKHKIIQFNNIAPIKKSIRNKKTNGVNFKKGYYASNKDN